LDGKVKLSNQEGFFDKMKFILMIYVLNNNYLMYYIDKMKAMKTGD